MTTPAVPAGIDLDHRRAAPLGGFNLTTLGLELKRVLRNRRSIVFTLVFPPVLLLAFGTPGGDDREGSGNVAAYVLISMALYGAVMAATTAGASVAMERAQGWSRQLRLTPLHPAAYVTMKAITAVVMAAVALVGVNAVALIQGKAHMPAHDWVLSMVLCLVCCLVFGAMGLMVGFLVPGENAMQIIGPVLVILAFLGDLFIPLKAGSLLYHVSQWTPMFGIAHVSRAPLEGDLAWTAVLNVVVWFVIFTAGAAWCLSRDTNRG